MHFAVTPSYRDIFKEEAPAIDSLISDIPSKAIISLLSAVNANLYFEPNNVETQRKIFRFWTQRFTPQQSDLIFQGMLPFLKASDSPTFFASWYVTEFIQRELIHYRDLIITDTTPDQEYRLFKAYFVIVELCNDSHAKMIKERGKENLSDEFRFQEVSWPMFAGQFDFNNKVDPVYQISKTVVLLKYLSEREKTSKYVQNFMRTIKRESLLHYVYDLLTLVDISFNHDESNTFKTFSLSPAIEFEILFDHWAIIREDIVSTLEKQVDYKGIRERPLFKISDGRYVVMNWSFLYNQLNLGLLFLFHKISGIEEIYPKFIDFRKLITKEVSEDIIFHRILKEVLSKKHAITVFDEAQAQGLPDCYHREGKYVMFFEFKDVLMPANVIGSCDYITIKSDVDTKFVESGNKKKGIRQIIQQIVKMNEGESFGDDFDKKGIKKRNIVIYPIIVFTHYMYSLPGINSYLNSVFRKELEEYRKTNLLAFAKINDVIMIDLEFLFWNFLAFKTGDGNFLEVLDVYLKKMKIAREKAKEEPTTKNIIYANSGFEEMDYKLGPRPKTYAQELFTALGIAF